jgi:glycosyltransferase involved in cell wall biosynthesis
MTLSIITITYNNPDELTQTLKSVPDYSFIEQVVVNGGSSKETPDILKNLKGISINEKDTGIADAFNKGTIRSTGDALMYLNSGDTIINPGYLKKGMDILNKNKDISFVHSNILFIDELGGELLVKPPLKNAGRGMKYLHPSMIIKREVFNNVGGFDTSYKIAMDFDFILKAEKQGCKGYYVNEEPAVKMPGGGRSQEREYQAIKECMRSLKENNLMTIKNTAGLSLRWGLFYTRRLILLLGGGRLLGQMKKIKYS